MLNIIYTEVARNYTPFLRNTLKTGRHLWRSGSNFTSFIRRTL